MLVISPFEELMGVIGILEHPQSLSENCNFLP